MSDVDRNRRFYPWLFDKMRNCSTEFVPDVDGCQVSSSLDQFGRELPDSVPLAPPVGMSSAPSLADFVQRMIRNEVSRAAALEQAETFEEADDFDTGEDDIDPLTDYEAQFDPRYQAVWKAMEAQEKALDKFVQEDRARGVGGGTPPTVAPPGAESPPDKPLDKATPNSTDKAT